MAVDSDSDFATLSVARKNASSASLPRSDTSTADLLPAEKHFPSTCTPDPLEWDGPNDPDNPLNWSSGRKNWYATIPMLVATLCTISSSIYTPGREKVEADFRVSSLVSLLPYSMYIVGLAFGPMLAAPCSERFGRKAVYMLGVPLFALFTLGSALANGISSLTICRFLAGLSGSPGLSIGSATLADMWLPRERQVPMSLCATAPFLGPALG
jgi:MFS family permease